MLVLNREKKRLGKQEPFLTNKIKFLLDIGAILGAQILKITNHKYTLGYKRT